MLIIEKSRKNRQQGRQVATPDAQYTTEISADLLRDDEPALPDVSELQVVRHYTQLSQKNFSIDTHFYPLGSCTMKYNPKACNTLATLPQFLNRHPLSGENFGQGILSCLFDLQQILKDQIIQLNDQVADLRADKQTLNDQIKFLQGQFGSRLIEDKTKPKKQKKKSKKKNKK